MTGPAMEKSFAPTPVTNPSLLNSMAGETMAFENPVMGTRVPAPACRAMSSKIPIAVKNAAKNTRVTVEVVLAVSRDSPII